MIFVYSHESKEFVSKTYADETDPRGGKGIELVVTQNYVRWILPVFPTSSKKVTAYSLSDGDPIPVAIWTESMKQKADQLKQTAKGTWKLFSLIIAIAILMIVGFVYSRANSLTDKGMQTTQKSYRSSPQVNDIILVKIYPKDYKGMDDVYNTAFKIVRKDPNWLYIKRSSDQNKNNHLYSLSDYKKELKKIDTSEKAFSSDEEQFSLTSMRNTKQKQFIQIDNKENQDDLIEILYIDRP